MSETQSETLAPGMERVIYAGDSLIITDKEGQDFAVSAREADETMEFIKAFDEWNSTRQVVQSGPVLDGVWHSLLAKFNNLPMRIQRELPSIKGLGVVVPPSHTH